MAGFDLHERLRLAADFICKNPDPNRNFRPYFSYQLLHAPAYMLHTFFDTPHVTGRFLDALFRAESVTGEAVDGEVEAALVNQLFGCIGEEGFGWAEPGRTAEREAIMHDQRELLLALNGLIVHRQSERALLAAKKLCQTLWEVTSADHDVPGPALRPTGWAKPTDWESFRYAPANTGRLITALVQYYQASHDPLALQLSQRFVDHNLKHCFDADGALSEWAGFHAHSITGTVESIAEYGLLVNEQSYIEQARRIYDVGLRPYRSSHGWVKENLANESNDGEANNTGDLLRTALLLGEAGYPAYFEDAERMLRNHLLASQLLDADWISAHEAPNKADEFDRTYANIAHRAHGGFGFTTPNDWVTDQERKAKGFPLNSDLVQGAVQAIVYAWERAVRHESIGTKVDLLLSKDTPQLSVTSDLPRSGKLALTPHVDGNVFVRRPSWLDIAAVTLQINGVPQPVQANDTYLILADLKRNDVVSLDIDQKRQRTQEHINYRLYQLEWQGDQLLSMEPSGERIPLYR